MDNEYGDLVYENEPMADNQIAPSWIHDIPFVQSQKKKVERNIR